ncbi:MAG: type II toxin-antitoxin system RelE/ParE family toxin [Selenomonadaceae bacterium]|nr:type II toxin-antitoxin system RelE/ParE family toxin [Selenomonadaceae bacterium]MBP3722561.1 type II toxin-antitoxin system RelE/ParE family toxin [Selenomonadaceae bacterium]
MDFTSLPKNQQKIITRMIGRLMQNPQSKDNGGYGIPLGHKGNNNLTGLLEGKLRGEGLRIIYELDDEGNMQIKAIGVREDEKIYDIVAKRIKG